MKQEVDGDEIMDIMREIFINRTLYNTHVVSFNKQLAYDKWISVSDIAKAVTIDAVVVRRILKKLESSDKVISKKTSSGYLWGLKSIDGYEEIRKNSDYLTKNTTKLSGWE